MATVSGSGLSKRRMNEMANRSVGFQPSNDVVHEFEANQLEFERQRGECGWRLLAAVHTNMNRFTTRPKPAHLPVSPTHTTPTQLSEDPVDRHLPLALVIC